MAFAQFTTIPLDVVRNRIMSGTSKTGDDLSYCQTLTKLGKEEGLKGLFAGASPRVGKDILSGAIQFTTYEETKVKVSQMFEKK